MAMGCALIARVHQPTRLYSAFKIAVRARWGRVLATEMLHCPRLQFVRTVDTLSLTPSSWPENCQVGTHLIRALSCLTMLFLAASSLPEEMALCAWHCAAPRRAAPRCALLRAE